MPRRKRPKKKVLSTLLSEGEKVKEIAVMFDVRQRTIYKWLRYYNIVLPKLQIPPKEELSILYLTKKWSMEQIAQKYNVSYPTARRWLINYGIEIRTPVVKRPSKEELYDLYCIQTKSSAKIASMYDVNTSTISKWLAHYGIPSRHSLILRPSKEQLNQWYWDEEWTLPKIAEHCKVSCPAVRYWFIKFGISRRSISESQCLSQGTQALTKERLAELYHEKGLLQSEIGALFNITQSAVKTKMKLFGIKARSRANFGPRNGMFGRTHTPEARAKIREANRRQFSDPKAREQAAIRSACVIAEGRTKKTHTKPERAFAEILDNLDIDYIWQYRLGRYVYDFYLPNPNVLVEVQGTFWHADPRFFNHNDLKPVQQKNLARDIKKQEFAIEKGFGFLCFWEYDILSTNQLVITQLSSIPPPHSCSSSIRS